MKLKPLHLYQERWYVREEERTAASNGRDVLVIRDGQEKRPRLPPELLQRLQRARERLEARQHFSNVYRGGDTVLLDEFEERRDYGKRVILKTIRYRDKDLTDRAAVLRRRAAFWHEIEVLGRGYYFLPEPIDLFTLSNTQDAFPADAEGLRDDEPVLVYSYQYDTHLHFLPLRYGWDSFGMLRVRRILEQLIAFTLRLHQDGLLLQNLTPEHVILGRDDVVRLTGIGGVCRLSGGQVDPDAPNLGRLTRGYCDPTLIRSGDLRRMDWRQDMYSIAAIGYYLLTAIDPAEGPNGEADLTRLRGASRVLVRALESDVTRRFDSLAAFGAALGSGRVARTAVFVDVENASHRYRDTHNKERLCFKTLLRKLRARYPDEDLQVTFAAADSGQPQQEGFFRMLESIGTLVRVKPMAAGGMRQGDDMQLVRAIRDQVDQVENVLIVSSDGDFLSAMDYARERGCRIRQLGFGPTGRALQDAAWINERIDPSSLGDLSRR